METYNSALVLLEEVLVDSHLVVVSRLRRHINCNVSVGLREGVVDLVRELEDVVLDFALRLQGG